MKHKVTRNDINRHYGRVYQCDYCELQPLYSSSDAIGYNAGVYGWNYDVYVFGGVAITSGYRGMFGAKLPKKAKTILKNAAKYCSFDSGHPYAQRDAYLKRAKRAFEKAIKGEL